MNGGCDHQIMGADHLAPLAQLGPQAGVNPRCREIEGQDRQQIQKRLYKGLTPRSAGRAVGPVDAVEKLRGRDRGQKRGLSAQPVKRWRRGTRPRHLHQDAGVDQESHAPGPSRGCAAWIASNSSRYSGSVRPNSASRARHSVRVGAAVGGGGPCRSEAGTSPPAAIAVETRPPTTAAESCATYRRIASLTAAFPGNEFLEAIDLLTAAGKGGREPPGTGSERGLSIPVPVITDGEFLGICSGWAPRYN